MLDGTATLVAMTEAAVRIRAAAGTVVSRRRLFASAPEGVIRGVAAEYAESYGLPALLGLAGPETPKPATSRAGTEGEVDVPVEQTGDIRVQSGPDTDGLAGGRDRVPRHCGWPSTRQDRSTPSSGSWCLLAGFAAARNEGGFRVHCTRAVQAGAALAEVEHVVLMMLGTSLGLAPAVDALRWAHEELGEAGF